MKPVAITEEYFHGAVSFEHGDGWIRPWRLPFAQLKLFPSNDDLLVVHAGQPTGVRLRLKTDSRNLWVSFLPIGEPCSLDLVVDNEIIESHKLGIGAECVDFAHLPEEKVLEVWMPQDVALSVCSFGIDDEATIAPAGDDRLKWITYGTSITQCHGAHSPGRTWPAIAARKHDLNLTCLGYGGQCHIEPMVARMIRDLPADLITLKLSTNVYGKASMSERTFKPMVIGFVQIIREKHPATPIALVSPIVSPPRETVENSAGMSLVKMRSEVVDAFERLKAAGDENLYYFDGLELFDSQLVPAQMPDELHPNGDGYELIGQNFARLVLDNVPIG